MKTIEINLYKFAELSEESKKKAIENERSNGVYTDFVYCEAKNTVERFCEIFGVQTGRRTWLEYNGFSLNYRDEILDFSSERLKKYIINNFWDALYKGKYYSLWSKTEKSPNRPGDKLGKLKTRYSKVIFQSKNCNLTGVCYDESIMAPIYAFLDGSDYQQYNLDELFGFCFDELKNDIDSEIEAMQSDEYISEQLQANDYDFLETGKLY